MSKPTTPVSPELALLLEMHQQGVRSKDLGTGQLTTAQNKALGAFNRMKLDHMAYKTFRTLPEKCIIVGFGLMPRE